MRYTSLLPTPRLYCLCDQLILLYSPAVIGTLICFDPFSDVPDRAGHHLERRIAGENWMEASRLKLVLPQFVVGLPIASKWQSECMQSLISRVPSDEQDQRPSLLDYGAATPGFVESCHLSWEPCVSDHAISIFVLNTSLPASVFPKTHWKCRDEYACIEWIKTELTKTPIDRSVSHFCDLLNSVREQWGDKTSCRARRKLRMPLQLRSMYKQLKLETDPVQARVLRQSAWALRRQWMKDMAVAACKARVDKGKAVSRTKNLHRLTGVFADSSAPVQSSDQDISSGVGQYFERKWGCNLLQQREHIRNFIQFAEHHASVFGADVVEGAFFRLKRCDKLDRWGICYNLLYLVFSASPESFISWLRFVLSSSTVMGSLQAHARSFGKKSSISSLGDVRLIIPMGAIVSFLDRILAILLEPAIGAQLPLCPGIFVGARRYTQAQDIGHSLSLVVEKSLDNLSQGCIAQADIKPYFDFLPVLKILMFLRARGVDMSLLAAVARPQLLTGVSLCVGTSFFDIKHRSRGGLTGSQLALLLARIPVESTLLELSDSLTSLGYECDGYVLKASCLVYNMYTSAAFQGRHQRPS